MQHLITIKELFANIKQIVQQIVDVRESFLPNKNNIYINHLHNQYFIILSQKNALSLIEKLEKNYTNSMKTLINQNDYKLPELSLLQEITNFIQVSANLIADPQIKPILKSSEINLELLINTAKTVQPNINHLLNACLKLNTNKNFYNVLIELTNSLSQLLKKCEQLTTKPYQYKL